MSLNDHLVIDMDQHVREYVDIERVYRGYIDPQFIEPFNRLSEAVAAQREQGLTTNLFMNP